MKRNALNFALFYAGWFICVTTANWIAPLAVAAIALVQRVEWKPVAVAFLLGTVTDTLLERSGVLTYAGGPRLWILCPLWISSLWALFATTLPLSMSWLKGRPTVAFLLGAVAGPFTYWIAAGMGAVEMTTAGYAAIAIEFALYTPLLLALTHRSASSANTRLLPRPALRRQS
ncbi:MAG: DUF2878 domain-containing protein [Planctomycetota bacterium]